MPKVTTKEKKETRVELAAEGQIWRVDHNNQDADIYVAINHYGHRLSPAMAFKLGGALQKAALVKGYKVQR